MIASCKLTGEGAHPLQLTPVTLFWLLQLEVLLAPSLLSTLPCTRPHPHNKELPKLSPAGEALLSKKLNAPKIIQEDSVIGTHNSYTLFTVSPLHPQDSANFKKVV